jgi:hypothetical protein
LSYLEPPPLPTPVIVMKDVGGIVKDYQAQTDLYRSTGREVRLHECRSACTLALSLPNVCVYPDSVVKFHQAYNLRTHQTDFGVSQQLFEAYPQAVRARLGTLTRSYKVLRGTELIALGIRNCNEPQIMLAAKPPQQTQTPGLSPSLSGALSSSLSNSWTGVVTTFARTDAVTPNPATIGIPSTMRTHTDVAENLSSEMLFTHVPLPPARPASDEETMTATVSNETLPPTRPYRLSYSFNRPLDGFGLPQVMRGAQPILPASFVAYAELARVVR